MGKTAEINVNSINILVSNTIISGEIFAEGDFRIDGILKGNISIKGKLVVGNSGKIEGNIICQNADLSGEILGDITIEELIVLQASSKVRGDIRAGKLSVESGALFSGRCEMRNTNEETAFRGERKGK